MRGFVYKKFVCRYPTETMQLSELKTNVMPWPWLQAVCIPNLICKLVHQFKREEDYVCVLRHNYFCICNIGKDKAKH